VSVPGDEQCLVRRAGGCWPTGTDIRRVANTRKLRVEQFLYVVIAIYEMPQKCITVGDKLVLDAIAAEIADVPFSPTAVDAQ